MMTLRLGNRELQRFPLYIDHLSLPLHSCFYFVTVTTPSFLTLNSLIHLFEPVSAPKLICPTLVVHSLVSLNIATTRLQLTHTYLHSHQQLIQYARSSSRNRSSLCLCRPGYCSGCSSSQRQPSWCWIQGYFPRGALLQGGCH